MGSVKILSKREAQRMREAGALAAETLCHVGRLLEAGMTTEDINTIVHDYTLAAGARPAPLNYKGFPKSVCTSVNHVVCHGIPGPQKLRDGDIINVDVTSVLPAVNGWFGDTSATFYIGEPSALTKHVVEVARECLELGIAVVKPGARIGDIGHAIQTYAEAKGCSVVRTYTGHGIHRIFHDSPSVPPEMMTSLALAPLPANALGVAPPSSPPLGTLLSSPSLGGDTWQVHELQQVLDAAQDAGVRLPKPARLEQRVDGF